MVWRISERAHSDKFYASVYVTKSIETESQYLMISGVQSIPQDLGDLLSRDVGAVSTLRRR